MATSAREVHDYVAATRYRIARVFVIEIQAVHATDDAAARADRAAPAVGDGAQHGWSACEVDDIRGARALELHCLHVGVSGGVSGDDRGPL